MGSITNPTLTVTVPFVGCENGKAVSFAAIPIYYARNNVPGFNGIYTGTVSAYNGTGDMRIGNTNITVNKTFSLTKFSMDQLTEMSY